MPLKERTLNIPEISFPSKKDGKDDSDPVSPLLLSQESQLRRSARQLTLAQSLKKTPDEDEDEEEKTVCSVEFLCNAMKQAQDIRLLREETIQLRAEMAEYKRLLEKSDRREIERNEREVRLRIMSKRKPLTPEPNDDWVDTSETIPVSALLYEREMNSFFGSQEKRRKVRDGSTRLKDEERENNIFQRALQVEQGVVVAKSGSMMPPDQARFPLDNESSYGTSKANETPLSRVSNGTVGSQFSKASRLSETNPQQLFPYGCPCYGCHRDVCSNMRAIATLRGMALKKFGRELHTNKKDYSKNHSRRNMIYKMYKNHVNLKSIKNVPTCVILMAMEWFPSSSDNRSVQVLRAKYLKVKGTKLFSDEDFAARCLVLNNHSMIEVPTNNKSEWN